LLAVLNKEKPGIARLFFMERSQTNAVKENKERHPGESRDPTVRLL